MHNVKRRAFTFLPKDSQECPRREVQKPAGNSLEEKERVLQFGGCSWPGQVCPFIHSYNIYGAPSTVPGPRYLQGDRQQTNRSFQSMLSPWEKRSLLQW